MKQFQIWLATSPLASFLKVFSAGVLGGVLSNLDSLSINPAVAICLASIIPIVINWINPADTRYGKGEQV